MFLNSNIRSMKLLSLLLGAREVFTFKFLRFFALRKGGIFALHFLRFRCCINVICFVPTIFKTLILLFLLFFSFLKLFVCWIFSSFIGLGDR